MQVYLAATDWWVSIRRKLRYKSTQSLWSDNPSWIKKKVINLRLCHGKESPDFDFKDFRWCFIGFKIVKFSSLRCTLKSLRILINLIATFDLVPVSSVNDVKNNLKYVHDKNSYNLLVTQYNCY